MAALALGLLCAAGCTQPAGPEMVVYVAVDRGQSEPILRDFQSQSGIRVRAVYDAEASKTTGLVTRLVAESAAPRCDVFWNNELVGTLMLADRGMLDPLEKKGPGIRDQGPEKGGSRRAEGGRKGTESLNPQIPKSPSPSPQPSALPTDGDGSAESLEENPSGCWRSIALRARVIVYNTRYVSAEEVPRSILDLAEPRWRGKVAVANPQFGTTRAHVAALFAVLGPERARQFLRQLLANDVRIVDGNAMVKNLVARASPDASPIFLGLTDTDDVLSGQADGEPVGMVYPDQDAFGTLVVPSTVCLVHGAPHPEAARRLVEYLTGPEVEHRLTATAGFIPLRPQTPAGREIASQGLGRPRAMKVTCQELLQQLEPSSQWTREYFHP